MDSARIIDFHTHAFPDFLADRAMAHLEMEGNIQGFTDGRVSSLLRSMEEAGVARSVVSSIATKPEQYEPILKWSKEIASERIIPFPSVHPDDPQGVERLHAIRAAGFRGIKMHPYYQRYDVDEARLFPFYEAMQELDLILLCHTGFDLAFARDRKVDPVRIMRVIERFPRLRFVTTHYGAWEDWDEVRRHILGKPVYMDTSYSLDFLGLEGAKDILRRHPKEYLLFGTDSPWADQKKSIEEIRSMDLGIEREEGILYRNAERLLGLA